nr:hypothetical protein Itr_chr04CG21510 [Ipomoea trifida]
MGVSSSCGCGGYGTPDPGIDGLSSSVGAFSSCKAVSTCPYPNPPDCISSHSLLESSLNVQFLKAGKCLMLCAQRLQFFVVVVVRVLRMERFREGMERVVRWDCEWRRRSGFRPSMWFEIL